MSFDAFPHDQWPAVAAVLPLPWPKEAAAHDLRWHAARHHVFRASLPDHRSLAERWGWKRQRTLDLINSETWADPNRPWKWRRADSGQTPGNVRADSGQAERDNAENIQNDGQTPGNVRADSGHDPGSRARSSDHLPPPPDTQIPPNPPEPEPPTVRTIDPETGDQLRPSLTTGATPPPPPAPVVVNGVELPHDLPALFGRLHRSTDLVIALYQWGGVENTRQLLRLTVDELRYLPKLGPARVARIVDCLREQWGVEPGALAEAPVIAAPVEKLTHAPGTRCPLDEDRLYHRRLSDEDFVRWESGGFRRDAMNEPINADGSPMPYRGRPPAPALRLVGGGA